MPGAVSTAASASLAPAILSRLTARISGRDPTQLDSAAETVIRRVIRARAAAKALVGQGHASPTKRGIHSWARNPGSNYFASSGCLYPIAKPDRVRDLRSNNVGRGLRTI